MLASGLENLTNDLPLHPVFVAFVDRTARYLSGSERLSGSRLVDSFVALRAAADPAGSVANVEVIDPDGHRPLSLERGGTVESFRLQRAGYYQIRFADGRDAVIGVNPDRRESDLEPMPPGCATTMERKFRRRCDADGRRRAGGRKDPPVSLWWYVMLLALVVALAETALASDTWARSGRKYEQPQRSQCLYRASAAKAAAGSMAARRSHLYRHSAHRTVVMVLVLNHFAFPEHGVRQRDCRSSLHSLWPLSMALQCLCCA